MKRFICLILGFVLLASMAACAAPEAPVEPATSGTPADLGATTDPGERETIRIAYVAKPLSNPLFRLLGDGMQYVVDQINEEAGYERIVLLEFDTAQADATIEMLEIVDTLLTQDIDAFIITPTSSFGFADFVRTSNERGIPVIVLDTDIDFDEMASVGAMYDVFIGTDNFAMGEAIFNAAMEDSGGELRYILLGGFEGASTHMDMMVGFERAKAQGPDTMVQLAYQAANWDRNMAFEIASALLTAHPDVEAFLCFNDQMASGVIQALEVAGLTAGVDVLIYGSTFVGDGPQNIVDGRQEFSISRLPFTSGMIAMEQAMRRIEGLPIEHHYLVDDHLIQFPGRVFRRGEFTIQDGRFFDLDGNEIYT